MIIDAEATVYEALLKLDNHGVGALIVTNAGGNDLAGIVTERDFSKGARMFGDTFVHRPVSDVMTKNLETCSIADSIVDAMKIMKRNQIRHLPVVDRGEVVGVVSMRDVVTACIMAMGSVDGKAQRQVLTGAAPG
ncbi:MAG: CBS domain-containing protein [Gammaproteobacteria bacterium]|nr:CBS domain-containing protein [Gammaproteobacteria bacterium]